MISVLIADSTAAGRDRLAALLRAAGHEAVVASDPVDAAMRLRADRPTVVAGDLFLGSHPESRLVDQLLRDLAIDAIPALFLVDPGHEALARQVAWIGSVVVTAPAGDDRIATAISALVDASARPPGLAHEINNLLTTIVGYGRLLATRIDPADPSAGDLRHVIDAAERTATLTDTFLSPRSARRATRAVSTSAAAIEAAAQTPTVAPSDGAAVLVVDDERPIRFLIQQILRRAGYQVAEAATPADAHAWLDLHGSSTRLVISDLGLPGTGSSALFARLAAPAGPKVLFISGQAGHDRGDAMKPGVPFLQKPFTADELLRKVSSVIDR
jgi:DNA-binding NtrC family response regulator